VASTTQPRNEAVAKEIVDAGGEAVPLQLDVSQQAAVDDAINGIVQQSGRLDVLVNNAALKPGFVPPEQRLLKDLPLATWQRVLDVNITGAFLCARAAANVMIPRGHGSIINVSTLSAVRPREGEPAYAVTKAALNMLTKVQAMEVGDLGIAVNCMAVTYSLNEEEASRMAPQQRSRAMKPEAWVPIALHLARVTPAEANGEIFNALEWNAANGHGGPEVWSWGA
jgi:3-oxoacyl-[acyl-carrier protein] reductase